MAKQHEKNFSVGMERMAETEPDPLDAPTGATQMTKRWVSDGRQRRSRAYQAVLADLRLSKAMRDLKAALDRSTRHAMASNHFRKTGEISAHV